LIRLRCRQRRADTPRRSRPRAVGFKRPGNCSASSSAVAAHRSSSGCTQRLGGPTGSVMCNLYSMTNAIRDLFKVGRHHRQPAAAAGDLSGSDGSRRLRQRRRARIDHDALGHAEPAAFPGITTNIRNTKSPHWRRWLTPESRCLVPEGRLTSVMATTASQSSTKHGAIRPIVPNLTSQGLRP
jgi:hypothetical protein